jgi:hypothetical protein
MSNKSKVKGNGFERDVCKYLKEMTGLNFMRVPSSGGYIGASNKYRTDNMDESQVRIMDGDIITPEEWKDWSIETKFYKNFAWKMLFQPKGVAQLNNWIEQAKDTTKPFWMLIFKINNSGSYCVVDIETMNSFGFKAPASCVKYQGKYIIADMKIFLSENHGRFVR